MTTDIEFEEIVAAGSIGVLGMSSDGPGYPGDR